MAASTKISTRALVALEEERFEALPGGVFNKGFVRAYARCVGLDEEKCVAEYMAAATPATPELDVETMSSQVASSRPPRTGGPTAATVMGVIAVLVAMGLGALWLREQRKEAAERAALQRRSSESVPVPTQPQPQVPASVPAESQPAAATAAPETSAAAPATTPGATPLGGPEATSAGTSPTARQSASPPVAAKPEGTATGSAPVEISITATARSWISVRSDGQPVETVTLDPATPSLSARKYKAQEKLMLVVGNPAGVSVTYNGKPAGELGEEGKRTTIMFTPEGIEKR